MKHLKIIEWNPVELNWKIYHWSETEEDDSSDTKKDTQMGIHVLWEGYSLILILER